MSRLSLLSFSEITPHAIPKGYLKMKKHSTIKKSTVKKIFSYLKGHRLSLALTLIMGAVSVALSLYIPYLIGEAIDCIAENGRVDFPKIRIILFKGVLAVLVSALAQWLMNVINNKIAYSVVRDIRNDAFDNTLYLPLGYLDTHRTGETVSRIISDAEQFSDGLLLGFTQLFTGALTIIGTLFFMLSISPFITVIVVVLTPISLFVASFIARKTHSMFVSRAEANAYLTAFTDEAIVGQRVIAAFGQQGKKQGEFDGINEKYRACSLKAIFFSSLTNPCTRFVNSLVYAAVALTGAFSVIGVSGNIGVIFTAITVGNLATLLSYANQYTKPFNEISGVITELQNSLACAERTFALIDEVREAPDAENAYVIEKPSGDVALNNVSFSYTPERPLIQNLSLSATSGKRIAIVGRTGCGKTTLINLIMRFYDVCDGSVKMGFIPKSASAESFISKDASGESFVAKDTSKEAVSSEVIHADIKDITRKSMRACYGMVLQESWLKRGTVKENIIIGKPDATDEEIIAAAKASHAHSFIKRLPNGYDTLIGEDGGNLSQGQKQLLCITRVMLCLPPMLILDEATSSIDTRTEQKIQAAFATLMEGRTSFIVAHRLSTIRSSDIILVMKDGNVVEMGGHEELMAKNGVYAELEAAGRSALCKS